MCPITPRIYTVNIYKLNCSPYILKLAFTPSSSSLCGMAASDKHCEVWFQYEYLKLNKKDALHVSKQESL